MQFQCILAGLICLDAVFANVVNYDNMRIARDAAALKISERAIVDVRSTNGVQGLSDKDWNRIHGMGVKYPGVNAYGNNGKIWIGGGGRFTLRFKNSSPKPIVLILWHNNDRNDYQGMWLNERQAEITYSLGVLESVDISVANQVPNNAFSAVYDNTRIEGFVKNTWGEFSVTDYATIDVSRNPSMKGHGLRINSLATGCVADLTHCAFFCKNPNVPDCWQAGSYDLANCDGKTNPGAQHGFDSGQPSGGCSMGSGGLVNVAFLE